MNRRVPPTVPAAPIGRHPGPPGLPRVPIPGTRRISLSDKTELIHLGLYLCLIGAVGTVLPASGFSIVVIIFSVGFAGIMLAACYRQVSNLNSMIWSASTCYRLATAVFVVFGTAIPYIVNQESQHYLYSIYLFSDQEVLKFLTMSAACTFVVMLIAQFFYVTTRSKNIQKTLLNSRTILIIAIVFLALGGLARYGAVLPRYYGAVDVAVAGWLSAVAKSYLAGLFLLLLWALRYARALIFIPVTLIAIDLVAGVLAWDKSEVVFTLAFAYLAFIYSKFSFQRAAVGLVGILAVIYLSQPLVHYGRSFIGHQEQ